MIINGKLAKYGPPLDGTPSPTLSFYVKDNKLFTHDDKQIKVFHYIEGLGCQSEEIFINKVNNGFPYAYKVIDPAGRYVNASVILPDLKRIMSISYDSFGSKLYIVDGLDSKVYQLDLAVIPLQ
jgi:hypothetical protein